MKPKDLLNTANHENGKGMEPLPVKPELVALFKYLKTESPAKIIISTIEDTVFLEVEEIVHVSGSSNYSTFYLTGGEKIMASKGLKYFEDMLPEDKFFRSHQSHLINLLFTSDLSTSDITDEDKGRGVGMSSILQPVKQLGGRITVKTNNAIGTTFMISFPKELSKANLAAA